MILAAGDSAKIIYRNFHLTIPVNDIYKLIKSILDFPQSQVCKHYVCCQLLTLLEDRNIPISKELAGAIVEANDKLAIQLLDVCIDI